MIRVWRGSSVDEEYTLAIIKDIMEFTHGGQPFPIYRASVAGRFPEAIVEIESPYPPADYFDADSFFMVSERLRKELERFQVPAEFMPVKVFHHGKPYTEHSYYFANIRDEVECLDEVKGKYTYREKPGWTHWVDKIIEFKIDESKTTGHHLFFIARISGPIFCASDDLQAAIQDKGFTGIRFVDLEKWP